MVSRNHHRRYSLVEQLLQTGRNQLMAEQLTVFGKVTRYEHQVGLQCPYGVQASLKDLVGLGQHFTVMIDDIEIGSVIRSLHEVWAHDMRVGDEKDSLALCWQRPVIHLEGGLCHLIARC